MGKGDIRTRRGKVWRGTYGVTRPQRWKTVIKPVAKAVKAKSLKDLPKAATEAAHKAAAQAVQQEAVAAVQNAVVETSVVDETAVEGDAKKAAKKTPAAKKAPVAKKAPAAKKKK